jgi:hypothetical protein
MRGGSGGYYARVAAVDDDGNQGGWTKARRFHLTASL